MSSEVFEDDNPPSIKANNTKGKIKYLLFSKQGYLFLKNLESDEVMSLVKEEPFGLASIKI